MKKLFFLLSGLVIGGITFGQNTNPVQKTRVDTLQKKKNKKEEQKIIKELKTPSSYWIFTKGEDGKIDTVMVFGSPDTLRKPNH